MQVKGLCVWQILGLCVAGPGFVRGRSRVWVWQVKGFGCGRSKVWAWQVKGLCAARLGFGRGRSRFWVWQVKGFSTCHVCRSTCGGSHLPRVAGPICHAWQVDLPRAAGLTCHAWRFEIQPFFCFQFVPFFGGVLIIMCSFDMIAPFCPFRASIYFSQLDV